MERTIRVALVAVLLLVLALLLAATAGGAFADTQGPGVTGSML